MISDRERMIEWLRRSADTIYELRKKPRLAKEKRLMAIRENYNIINVLTMVAENRAYMMGINPPNDTTRE